MTRRLVLILSLFIASLFILSCSLGNESSKKISLERNVNPCGDDPRIVDICEPHEYVRGKSKPVTEETEFSAPFPGAFCLVVVNGDHGPPQGKRISSAVISIDGEHVIGPNLFNQNVGLVTKAVHLEQGQHVLGVQLRSKPGSKLVVAIRGIPDDLEPPSVSLVYPSDGSPLSASLNVTCVAEDESGIATVELLVDGDSFFEREYPLETSKKTFSGILDTGLLSNGEHLISARAVDIYGNIGVSDEVRVIVDNPAGLAISKISPPSGAPATLVNISGNGFDPQNVDVYFSGVLGQVETATTTTIITTVPVGASTGNVRVTTSAGSTESAEVFVALAPRVTVVKRDYFDPLPWASDECVDIKFIEGSMIRLRGGHVVSIGVDNLGAYWDVSSSYDIGSITRLFSQDEFSIEYEQFELQKSSGEELGDLNLYFRVCLEPGGSVTDLIRDLNGISIVELAQPVDISEEDPGDIIPVPTLDFHLRQGYRLPAANFGVDADYANSIPGGLGQDIVFIDVETNWILTHEDFTINHPGLPLNDLSQQMYRGGNDGNHGTATLGVIFADDDDVGVRGIAPLSTGFVVTHSPAGNRNNGAAIAHAATFLEAGDVLVMEMQVRNQLCTDGTIDIEWAPSECEQAVYDEVKIATARGIIVVAAAGNGYTNLDDPAFRVCEQVPGGPVGGCFDRNFRDSGAIIVGAGKSAGAPVPLERLNFSNYGVRVDVQGWGDGVTTTGSGGTGMPPDWDGGMVPPDPDQFYTFTWGGTSSATAIVSGAVTSLQGVCFENFGYKMNGIEMRDLLVRTGTPQRGLEHIGPLPDLKSAIYDLGLYPTCIDFETRGDGTPIDGSIRIPGDEYANQGIIIETPPLPEYPKRDPAIFRQGDIFACHPSDPLDNHVLGTTCQSGHVSEPCFGYIRITFEDQVGTVMIGAHSRWLSEPPGGNGPIANVAAKAYDADDNLVASCSDPGHQTGSCWGIPLRYGFIDLVAREPVIKYIEIDTTAHGPGGFEIVQWIIDDFCFW